MNVRVLIDEAGCIVDLVVDHQIEILFKIGISSQTIGDVFSPFPLAFRLTFLELCVETSEKVNSWVSDMVERL